MGHDGGKENVQRSEIGRVQSEQCRAQGDARQPQRAKEHKALTTQTAFFKAGSGAAPAPGRGPPGTAPRPKSGARSVRARPRSPRRQNGTCRRVARAVRFVPAVRDPGAAALAVRCYPDPAARGNCGPLARLARRALFGRPRGFVSARSGRGLPRWAKARFCMAPKAAAGSAVGMPVAFRAMPGIPAPGFGQLAGRAELGLLEAAAETRPRQGFTGFVFASLSVFAVFYERRIPSGARGFAKPGRFFTVRPHRRRGVCKIADSNLRAACCAPAHCRLAHLA